MPVKAAKARNASPPVTKICSKCKQKRPINDFYSNRDWIDQLGKDVWCKSCTIKCATKDELREYFWENCRKWNERLWESCQKKAELEANKKKVYVNTTEERRKLILERLTCQHVIKSMQLSYEFEDHTNDINTQTYQEAKENGQIIEEKDPNVKVYSEFFNGYFKPDELRYLEDYYNQLENDFELSDINLRDTAKKLAKQSLLCDRIQDKYAAGQATLADVKDAMAMFDLLSKSGNFSASKRKPGEKGGMGSWGELSLYLETHGYPMTRKIEWEKDDIDKIIDQYRYITKAIGLDET